MITHLAAAINITKNAPTDPEAARVLDKVLVVQAFDYRSRLDDSQAEDRTVQDNPGLGG